MLQATSGSSFLDGIIDSHKGKKKVLSEEELAGHLCAGLGLVIKQQTPKGTVAFVPNCELYENSDGTLILHDTF